MKRTCLMLWSLLAAASFGQQLGDGAKGGVVERIYSKVITNLQWSTTEVAMKDNGELFDPTGMLASQADVAFLERVNEGMAEILDAGSNAFVRAKEEFYAALSNNPPQTATHVSMILPPHEDIEPTGRNPYGLLVAEQGRALNWYLSHPFTLKPVVVCETIRLGTNGKPETNYDDVAWVDYHNDATNFPEHAIGDFPRTIRMQDAPIPAGIKTVIRDSHMHFGHPKLGFEWGGMALDVIDANGDLRHTLTGVYTATVNQVKFEFQFKNGATLKCERVN